MATAERSLDAREISSRPGFLAGCRRLVRPGLLAAVLLSMAAAAVATPGPVAWPRLMHALLGTALVIAGASAVNQLLERRADAQMARTASRPLPSGQWTTGSVTAWAMFLSVAGMVYLAVFLPPPVALLAGASWILYVAVYTPLKRSTAWHIPVGALAGAMPVLLGAAVAGDIFAPAPLVLFGVVFFWQFPHTAAIGWLHRDQYARGGTRVAAVVDPTGRLSGRLAVLGAVGLVVAGVASTWLPATEWSYGLSAVILAFVPLALAIRFFKSPSDATARPLWRALLFYLPVALALSALAARG